jgi:AcrR family transcriptional regulator
LTVAAVAGSEAQPRRSERKARTRQALVDAALELVAEHGFDAITTDDIAAAAGVSPRTFFRYFATKESVLLFGEDDFVTSFTGVYLAQPAELAEIDAIAASFVSLAPGVARLHGRIRLYHKALLSSYVLRGQEQAHLEENVARVADALARRRGTRRADPSCALLAAVSMATLHNALFDWAAGSSRADLGKMIDDRFAMLVSLVTA